MSLLDDLAKGQIEKDHDCMVPTQYGMISRHETCLFAYDNEKGNYYHCICGRRFKAVDTAGGYIMWKER